LEHAHFGFSILDFRFAGEVPFRFRRVLIEATVNDSTNWDNAQCQLFGSILKRLLIHVSFSKSKPAT